MSAHSAEQARAACVGAMGEQLGSLYHALWQEVAWIHLKWHEYVVLFGTKESRVDLLNRAAPSFFRLVADALWDDILIHLTRLTDPPMSVGRSNLTIQRLHSLVAETALSTRVNSLEDAAVAATAFCRDWRNRRIAHHDLDLALNAKAKRLASASRKNVRVALEAIVEVLNSVSAHYLKSTNLFERTVHANGALFLLYVIDDGLRMEAERHARHARGQIEANDVRPRDL